MPRRYLFGPVTGEFADQNLYQARRAGVCLAFGPGAGFYSTCRTCEIGMSRAVGRPYLSLVHLVREALLGG